LLPRRAEAVLKKNVHESAEMNEVVRDMVEESLQVI
jgi:hypothetical protein